MAFGCFFVTGAARSFGSRHCRPILRGTYPYFTAARTRRICHRECCTFHRLVMIFMAIPLLFDGGYIREVNKCLNIQYLAAALWRLWPLWAVARSRRTIVRTAARWTRCIAMRMVILWP